MFGIGWLLDGCRLCYLVKEYNEDVDRQSAIIEQLIAQQGGTYETYFMTFWSMHIYKYIK